MGLVASIAGMAEEKCLSAGFALFIFKSRRCNEAGGEEASLLLLWLSSWQSNGHNEGAF